MGFYDIISLLIKNNKNDDFDLKEALEKFDQLDASTQRAILSSSGAFIASYAVPALKPFATVIAIGAGLVVYSTNKKSENKKDKAEKEPHTAS